MATPTATIPYTGERAVPKTETSAYSGTSVAIFLGLLMLFVLVISVFFFSNQSLRLDESQSLWQTSLSPAAMFKTIAQDVHVPLYHILLHFWQLSFGNSVPAARDLSLIFFVLMIPVFYITGAKAYSQTVGLFAALLAALSPFLNWYGNEIRMYSMFALFTMLNQYFFMRLFMDKRDGRGEVSRYIWFGYIATLVIGMFTHYFFAFNAIAQAVFYFTNKRLFPKRSLSRFIATGFLCLALFTPWLYFVYHLGSAANTQPVLDKPSTIDVFNSFSQFVFGFQDDRVNTLLLSLWPLLVLFIFLSLRRGQKIKSQTVYLFISLFLPVALAFAVSQEWKPIYVTRYLILALPSLFLLVSWILSTYPERLARIIKVSLVVGMGAMLAIEVVNASTPVKENYRGASDYIAANAAPTDIIALSAPFTIYPFEYYYQGPDAVVTLPVWDQYSVGAIPAYSPQELSSDVAKISDSHETLWLLLSYDQGYEKDIKMYFDTHYQRVDARSFSPNLDLYAYRLRYDDISLAGALKKIGESPTAVASTISHVASSTVTATSTIPAATISTLIKDLAAH